MSVEESKTDLYSSIGVIIITLLLQFSNRFIILKYVDLIGSVVIGLIVLRTSLKIIISNSLSIIGEIDDDEEKVGKVNDYLSKYSFSYRDKDNQNSNLKDNFNPKNINHNNWYTNLDWRNNKSELIFYKNNQKEFYDNNSKGNYNCFTRYKYK